MRPADPVLLALALLAAGCGGDDGAAAEDYRGQANAICAEAKRQAAELPPPAGDTSEAVAEYAGARAPIVRDELEALSELEPPDELADGHEQLLRQTELEAQALENLQQAAAAADRGGAEIAARQGQRAAEQRARTATELELRECVLPFDTPGAG